MTTSQTIHTFTLTNQEGALIITANEYPWSTMQVITFPRKLFNHAVKTFQEKHGGYIATHDTDRTFLIIHLSSGDTDGNHPDRHIPITQQNHEQILTDLRDTMAQAAVWYYTNVSSLINK